MVVNANINIALGITIVIVIVIIIFIINSKIVSLDEINFIILVFIDENILGF